MDPAAILALIVDLYSQVHQLTTERDALVAQLRGGGTSAPDPESVT